MNTRAVFFCSVMALAIVMPAFNASGQGDCISDPRLYVDDVEIVCEDMFSNAHLKLRTTFEAINAYDVGCDVDINNNRIRVKQINRVKPNGRYNVLLDLQEIEENVSAFYAGEYDYSVQKTWKLFHYYFIFKPGVYEVYYYILDDDGEPIDAFNATRKQVIIIDKACGGCLGCLRCDTCAGCRDDYIPDFVRGLNLKRFLGDWLLIGLSALVLLTATQTSKSGRP